MAATTRAPSPEPVAHRFGAVAQLGERLVRNEEVSGSIPLGSTTLPVRIVFSKPDHGAIGDPGRRRPPWAARPVVGPTRTTRQLTLCFVGRIGDLKAPQRSRLETVDR
jgi:hypothetical protein